MENLSVDNVIDITRNLSARSILQLCQSNKNIQNICNSTEFMMELLLRRYKIKDTKLIPGLTLREKYNFILQLVNQTETLTNRDLKLYLATVEIAKTLNNKEFTDLIYRRVMKSFSKAFNVNLKNIPGRSLESKHVNLTNVLNLLNGPDVFALNILLEEPESSVFRMILKTVLVFRSDIFLQTIINDLLSRVTPQDRYLLLPSFRRAFMKAIEMQDARLIAVLSQYYDPNIHMNFKSELLSIVKSGNLDRFKMLLPYINIDSEDFSIAVENNKYELADFIRSILAGRGNDPLSSQSVVAELFHEAISDDDREVLKYLVERGLRIDPRSYVQTDYDVDPSIFQYLEELQQNKI